MKNRKIAFSTLATAVVLLASISAEARPERNTVGCVSAPRQVSHCDVDDILSARLLQQSSAFPCIQGRTWGWDHTGIWVSDGCSANFDVLTDDRGGFGRGRGRPGFPGGPGRGPRPPQEIAAPRVSLGSKGQSYTCPAIYMGYPLSRADISAYNGAERTVNGCYVDDKSGGCDITCYYLVR